MLLLLLVVADVAIDMYDDDGDGDNNGGDRGIIINVV